jgi:uncharacterized phage protein (TIGR02220 family)/predicted phage replisome organizer
MSNKRYYWLKLNDNFFEDDTIVWLEEQNNGKDYVIFYLKLLLKSLKEEGTLVRYVGERLMPYDTNSLAKLTNTPVDTVRVAMQLFIEFGLVKQMDAGELYLTQIDEMIGTETDSARRVRKHRAIKNANEEVKILQCNEHVTKSNIEIDIELEKEIEKEIDIELEKNNIFEQIPFKEIIEYLNGKVNRQYRNVEANKKLIRARFNEGYTLQDFKDVIDKKCIEWSNTEMSKYLRPQTLFGTKFDSYLNLEVKSKRNNYDAMIFDENGMLIE